MSPLVATHMRVHVLALIKDVASRAESCVDDTDMVGADTGGARDLTTPAAAPREVTTVDATGWAALVMVLAAAFELPECQPAQLRLVLAGGSQSDSSGTTGEGGGADADASDNAWQALLASDFHAAFEEADQVLAGSGCSLRLADAGTATQAAGVKTPAGDPAGAVDAAVLAQLRLLSTSSGVDVDGVPLTKPYSAHVARSLPSLIAVLHCLCVFARCWLGVGARVEKE